MGIVAITILILFHSYGFSNSYKIQSRAFTFGQKHRNTRIFLLKDPNKSIKIDVPPDFQILDLNILDLYPLVQISCNEFLPSMKTHLDKFKLVLKIISIFLPSLILPWSMRHSIIGVKTKDGNLAAFVDLSLQTSSGSDEALLLLTYEERALKFNDLRPYLCNLLVSPKYRKKGLGTLLIKACESKALLWGHNDIYLHTETTVMPALSLYIKNEFEPVKKVQDMFFMRKRIKKI
eukprot:gene10191-21238_t